MKASIFFALLLHGLHFSNKLLAQTPQWEWVKTFDGDTGHAYAKDLIVDQFGNSYVCGAFSGTITFDKYRFVAQNLDIFLAKLDRCGNVVWVKQAGGKYGGVANGIALDREGNCLITGVVGDSSFFDTTLVNGSHKYGNIFVAKYDGFGNNLWVRNSRSNSQHLNCSGQRLSTDTSGNVYFIADIVYGDSLFFGNISISNTGYSLGILIGKYDKQGAVKWVKNTGMYAPGAIDGGIRSIRTDKQGNSYVIGDFEGSISFEKTKFICRRSLGLQVSRDVFVVKYDNNGNVVWAKQEGGDGADHGCGLDIDSLGNSYISGLFANTLQLDSIFIPSNSTPHMTFVAKLNSYGDAVWAQKMDRNPDMVRIYLSKQQKVFTPFAEFDTGGRMLWTKNYLSPLSSFTQSFLYGAGGDYAGNLYVAGFLYGTAIFDQVVAGSKRINDSAVLIGKLQVDLSNRCIDTPLLTTNDHFPLLTQSYPNPFSESFIIRFSTNQENTIIKIFDLLGRECRVYSFTGKEFLIERKDLKNGMYFLHLQNALGERKVSKIFVK